MVRDGILGVQRVLLVAAIGAIGSAAATCTQEGNQDHYPNYYAEYPLIRHADTCGARVNAECTPAGGNGACSLWGRMIERCISDQPERCYLKANETGVPTALKSFVYLGRYINNDHVISVATAPVRGVEDIYDKENNAVERTRQHWKVFWGDSLKGNTGSDFAQGFKENKGGLIINPPNHREYHQLHIHGGQQRTKQFEYCLQNMTYKANGQWQSLTCLHLQEEGDAKTEQVGQLRYKTITELEDVWDAYREGMALQGTLKINIPVAAANPTIFIPDGDRKYHVGVLITRGPKLFQYADQYFVVLYAPLDAVANAKVNNGIGRGHFFLQGQ